MEVRLKMPRQSKYIGNLKIRTKSNYFLNLNFFHFLLNSHSSTNNYFLNHHLHDDPYIFERNLDIKGSNK